MHTLTHNKQATLILLQLLMPIVIFAQTPPGKQWDKTFGGNGADNLNSLQQTFDGGYILGGHSTSGISGDKTQESRGFNDYWAIKIDSSGKKQWDKRFGGSDAEWSFSVQQTSDGGYILGGYSRSEISGDKTQKSRGRYDYWIVKTDAHGIKQWDKRFGGNFDDYLFSLQQTSDGGYILGGFSNSGISGDKTEASQGFGDYWIVKVDVDGIKQWDKTFGGDFDDYLFSLQQTSDGGYILGGFSNSGISGDKTEASQGLNDYWVIKINSDGSKQWDKRFGGSDNDQLFSLQQNSDGGYLLGGYSYSGISGDKTEASRGLNDYWVIRIDGDGNMQWDKRFGGSDLDYLFSVQQTSEGGYILGGYSWSGVSGDKTEVSWGEADYWIVKINANGIKQWDKRFGGSGDDNLRSIQQASDGGYSLGGFSTSEISGDKTEVCRVQYDYWVVKVYPEECSLPTGLSVTDITVNSATLAWEEVTGVAGYKVRYRVAGTSDWIAVQSNDNDKTLSGLTPNTEYVWQVKTICGVRPIISSEWPEKQFFTTNSLKLPAESESELEIGPNPFSRLATISFTLNQPSNVSLKLFSVEGIEVMTVADENFSEGNYKVQLNGKLLSAGIYFVQLKTDESVVTKKVIIE